jgi:alpha-glucan,water dikinase
MQLVRSTAAAPLSQLINVLELALRRKAGLGLWQLVSPGRGPSVTGRLVSVRALSEVQGKRYPEATILLVDVLGGDEDIPEVR